MGPHERLQPVRFAVAALRGRRGAGRRLLRQPQRLQALDLGALGVVDGAVAGEHELLALIAMDRPPALDPCPRFGVEPFIGVDGVDEQRVAAAIRSEEHTSELQSLMRSSYAVFCWKKKT